MLLDSIHIALPFAASMYAGGDSYHCCRACMCGRDYYAHIHVAMEYADYLSSMFPSSERLGHYPSYLEDCRDDCDDNYGAWNCSVLVSMVHVTGLFLWDRLFYGGYIASYHIPVGYQEKLYVAMAASITLRRSKLQDYSFVLCMALPSPPTIYRVLFHMPVYYVEARYYITYETTARPLGNLA